MKNFTSITDIDSADPMPLVEEAINMKNSNAIKKIGAGKTLGLIFLNSSLRTRMSSEKAAFNLGMNTMVMNLNNDGWNIEYQDGAIMNGSTQEHIQDAVKVMSGYCDIIGVRTFGELKNQHEDYQEKVLNAFLEHSSVPVISLESATLHPLQSLADLITIKEFEITKPKIVVSWAPHPKALPQAVVNSFLEWIKKTDAEVMLTHPEGYNLADKYTNGIEVNHDQNTALKNADFVYVKNWSSYEQYGQVLSTDMSWTINAEKMALTNNGKFMHCMPIRRNVIATDEVIDNSIIYQQAKNREYSAQIVLSKILQNL
jgi:N-succinyl-L-ornithine transcarbamylase